MDGLESPSGHWTGRELGEVAKAIPVEKYKAVTLKVEDEITCVHLLNNDGKIMMPVIFW